MRLLRGGSFPSAFLNVEEEAYDAMAAEEVMAGSALMFDSALVHYSPANKTPQPRLSIVTTIVPESTELQIYYLQQFEPRTKIEVFSVEDSFFLKYSDFKNQQKIRPWFGSFKYGFDMNYDLVLSIADFKNRLQNIIL